MPIHHALWTVGDRPIELVPSDVLSEADLESMIVASPRILSSEWMLIGRQLDTGHGGRVDLLAIAPDGALVLIELKRNRTPRDVVAQALDYASWVEKLDADEIAAIYAKFSNGGSLAASFRERFGQPIEEEQLNQDHQIVVVAAKLDPSTERIVEYLNDRGVPINVLFFQVFQHAGDRFLSRAWLADPAEVQVAAATTSRRHENEPWNGEFYVNFGASESRDWKEAVDYGFVSAGGGSWYTKTLGLLEEGDRIWVSVPNVGYVGVARIDGPVTAAKDFEINGRPALEVLQAEYYRDYADDPEMSEYFVPVRWLQTVPLDQAVREVGMFGNQNTVCKPRAPRWRSTVEKLKAFFPRYDE